MPEQPIVHLGAVDPYTAGAQALTQIVSTIYGSKTQKAALKANEALQQGVLRRQNLQDKLTTQESLTSGVTTRWTTMAGIGAVALVASIYFLTKRSSR